MNFTKEDLQVIETALETAQDNTGDDEWYGELADMLEKVRKNLRQLEKTS